MSAKTLKRLSVLILFVLAAQLSFAQDMTIEFQFTDDPGNEQLNGSFRLCNNTSTDIKGTGYTIDFRWPILQSVANLTANRNGAGECDTWTWEFENWQLPNPNSCHNVYVTVNYSGSLSYPAYGIDSNGDTVWVVTNDPDFIPKSYHAGKQEYQFDPECFIPSPDVICLGEAQIREWNEPVDVRVPDNRKGWAIAATHVATLFNNMSGLDLYTPDYVFAQSIIEGRMGCDAGIVMPGGDDNPVDFRAIATGSGCFQILPPGWAQIEQYYPTLTAPAGINHGSMIAGDNFITAALSKVLYDMTTFTKYEKISCADPIGFFQESADPYAIETLIAYAYHEGPYGSEGVLMDIFVTNRATTVNETNLAAYIASISADASVHYAERMRNNLIQLENNFGVAGGNSLVTGEAQTNWPGGGTGPSTDYEYHGCYDEPMTWADFDAYIDEAARLFWTADVAAVKAAAQAAFNAINGGAPVNYSQCGPVIDAMTLAFPVYSPDEGVADLFFASACGSPTVTMSSCDRICPGEEGELWVHLMGVPPFSYTIETPSGAFINRTGVMEATDVVNVNEPGTYKVTYIEDANGEVFLNCHSASSIIENAGDASAFWNKGSVVDGCASGDLQLDLTGTGPWEITYKKNDGADVVINVPDGVAMPYTVATEAPVNGDEYVLTRMVAGGCDSDLNDTIRFCSEDCTEPEMTILTPDTTICDGDVANIRIEFTGIANFDLHYSIDGVAFEELGITDTYFELPIAIEGLLTIDSLVDNACINRDIDGQVRITVNPIPVVDLGADYSVCDGSYPFDINGPAGMDVYTWNGVVGTDVFAVADSGRIILDVELAGCSASDTIYISTDTLPIVDLGLDTNLCVVGGGAYLLDAGSPGSTYAWSDGSGAQTLNVVTSGTYNVTVTDGNGCEGTDEIDVNINEIPVVDLGADISICSGDHEFDATAGAGAATYRWKDGSTNATFTGIATDAEIWVIVTENSCSDTDTVALTIGGSLAIDLGDDVTICEPEAPFEISLPGYAVIEWEDDLGNNSNTDDFATNATTQIRVRVEDATGCEGRDTIELVVNANPIVDLGGDSITICNTSPDVDFDAGNAGSTFVWSSGENTQVITKGNGDEGLYKVVVTTPEGCSDSDSIYLKVDTELTVNLGPVDTAICTGTTITLDAGFGAGYTYDWNGSGPTADKTFETGAAFVTVEVADASGCTGTADITVTEVNPLSIDLGLDHVLCAGDPEVELGMVSGRVDVTIIGWTGGSTDRTLTTDDAGIYTLEVDSAGCRATDDVEIIVNALPVVDLGPDTFVCAGVASVITLDAGAFAGYQWADITTPPGTLLGNIQTQDVTTVGTYAVGVTDINGCMNSDTIEVEERTATAVDISDQSATICPAGSHDVNVPAGLSVVAGASWVWTNDGSTGTSYEVSGEPDGASVDVTLEYTNEFGCVTTAMATVDVSNVLPINLRDTSVCEGGDITILSGYPAAGYTFTWQDGSAGNDFTLTGATLADGGAISVDIVSDEGCDGDANATLTINVLPNPAPTAQEICEGEVATIDHMDDDFVSSDWTNAGTGVYVGSGRSIDVSDAGTYEVTVTDVNGCVNTATADVIVNTNPVVNLAAAGPVCEGEIIPLNTGLDEATHTFQWSGESAATTSAIDATTSGTYTVEVEVILTGCTATDEVELTFNEVPVVDLGPDSNICEGQVIDIISNVTNQDYTYEWSGAVDMVNVTQVPASVSGVYRLTVSNGDCPGVDEIVVTVNENPISRLMNDTIICFEDYPDGFVLTAGRGGTDEYLWNTLAQETTPSITVTQRDQYMVRITNEYGCQITDNVFIKNDCPAQIWLPNSFTPDQDGNNEVFRIQGRGVESVELLVFNRWGELIWTGNSVGDFWDGTYNGFPVQQDVYVYKLTYSYMNSNERTEEKSRVGRVAIIR